MIRHVLRSDRITGPTSLFDWHCQIYGSPRHGSQLTRKQALWKCRTRCSRLHRRKNRDFRNARMKDLHFLALDGGGTGCRAMLCAADGRELGRAMGGGANLASDFKAAHDNIHKAIGDVYQAAGLPQSAMSAGVAVLGVAGADIGNAAARLQAGLFGNRLLRPGHDHRWGSWSRRRYAGADRNRFILCPSPCRRDQTCRRLGSCSW